MAHQRGDNRHQHADFGGEDAPADVAGDDMFFSPR